MIWSSRPHCIGVCWLGEGGEWSIEATYYHCIVYSNRPVLNNPPAYQSAASSVLNSPVGDCVTNVIEFEIVWMERSPSLYINVNKVKYQNADGGFTDRCNSKMHLTSHQLNIILASDVVFISRCVTCFVTLWREMWLTHSVLRWRRSSRS